MKKWCKTFLSSVLIITAVLSVTPVFGFAAESGWVLPSEVPANAVITDTSYSYRESKESTESSLSGWTANGSYWKKTGSGSKQYASFPSTYKTSHATYTELNGSAYTAYENTNNKREVSNTHTGYVYWHWAYNAAYYNNTSRWISDRKQTAGSNRDLPNYAYSYFFAFKSTTDAPKISGFTYTWSADAKYNSNAVTYNCSNCLPSGADKSATSGLNNPRFLRLNYYTSTYTDYVKTYKYYRDMQYQHTDPGNGSNITNKVVYVKYEKDFRVTYNANGGTNAPGSQEKPRGETINLTTAKPTRANIVTGSYTVTLDPNGGTVSQTSVSAARTTSYSFQCWNTEANGSGTSYMPGASYAKDEDLTLYAQWNSSISTSAVTLPTPSREGYLFQGWAADSTAASGRTGSYTPDGDVTLYAIWRIEKTFDVTRDAYPFGNNMSSFGYTSRGPGASYPIKYEPAFKMIFGDSVAGKSKFKQAIMSKWGGNCCGMSSTTALLYANAGVSASGFGKSNVAALSISDSNGSMSVLTFVEAMQVAQYTDQFARDYKGNRVYNYELAAGSQKLSTLFNSVSNAVSQGRGTIIGICRSGVGAHALYAYDFETISASEKRMYVYDCNCPGETVYFTLHVNDQGMIDSWTYDMGGYGVWGGEGSDFISFIPYETIAYIWNHRGNLYEGKEMLSFSSENLSIMDFSGQEVAAIVNGQLQTNRGDIYELPELSMSWRTTKSVFLPKDFYTVVSNDGSALELSMVDYNSGASVTTSASAVSFAVDDSTRENTVIVENASQDDTYSVSLESSFAGVKYENVVVRGTGRGESISISGDNDTLSISNCNVDSLQINGVEHVTHTISTYSGTGGTISPSGDVQIDNDGSKIFTITPDDGYVVESVKIDGNDIGAVTQYEFKNIIRDHTITVIFKKAYGITEAFYDRSSNTVSADLVNQASAKLVCAAYTGDGQMLCVATKTILKDSETAFITLPSSLPRNVTIKLFILDSRWRSLCPVYSFTA